MYTTQLLTEDTWPDFARLVSANGGVWGGCWCMGFHPAGVGRPGQTYEHNREAKQELVRTGEVHQILVYDGDDAVGWCQFGRPVELPNIKSRRIYEQADAPPPDWRIGCVFTSSKRRERGIASTAVGAVLDEIRARGGGTVEAYPEQTVDRKPQRGAFLHTGPEELFTRHGFTRDRQIAKWRWVMRTELPAA